MSVIRQPSLFGVEASSPAPDDLAGLLIAGGTVARWTDKTDKSRRSSAVALSVVVDHPWRASVLVLECARRGLAATCVPTDLRIAVRTAHSPLLVPVADAWGEEGERRVPRALSLDGAQLRLWVEAEGRYERAGVYLLASGPGDEADRERIGGALAAAGLPAQLVSARGGGGFWYRISGKKRLNRLAEMVGDPPKRAPVDIWPS